jgi:hypothetical protein
MKEDEKMEYYQCKECGIKIQTRILPSNGICPDCREKPKEKEDLRPIPISLWAERAKIVSEMIDGMVHQMLLSKKIGMPINPVPEDWVIMAAKKLRMPPIMIQNEIDFKIKEILEE